MCSEGTPGIFVPRFGDGQCLQLLDIDSLGVRSQLNALNGARSQGLLLPHQVRRDEIVLLHRVNNLKGDRVRKSSLDRSFVIEIHESGTEVTKGGIAHQGSGTCTHSRFDNGDIEIGDHSRVLWQNAWLEKLVLVKVAGSVSA